MITIPSVLIVTGTPGTGKTTVSTLLSKRLGASHVELSRFSVENGYVLEDDTERDTKIVDMEALGTALRGIVEESKSPVIIDGHYSHELLDESIVTHVYILRRKPWDLKTILESRQYSSEKVWENLEAEIMGIITGETLESMPKEKVTEVDVSCISPDETVNLIMDTYKGGLSGDKPLIDWVTYPETLRLLLSRPCTL